MKHTCSLVYTQVGLTGQLLYLPLCITDNCLPCQIEVLSVGDFVCDLKHYEMLKSYEAFTKDQHNTRKGSITC